MSNQSNENDKFVTLKMAIKGALQRLKDVNTNDFEAKGTVGSYFASMGKRPSSGLSDADRDVLMPIILGIPSDDRDYHKKLDEYFLDISTKIRENGLRLNIGKIYDNELGIRVINPEFNPKTDSIDKKYTLNLPLNIEHYVTYMHAVGHPKVASNLAEALNDPSKLYYIEDIAVETKAKMSFKDAKKKANTIFYKDIDEDANKADMYLTLLGIDTRYMDDSTKLLRLDSEVENNPMEFLEIHNDKNSIDRYKVMSYIQSGVMNRVGTAIVDAETNLELGFDEMEVVLWLRDKKNAQKSKLYSIRHEEITKGGMNQSEITE